MAIVTSTFLTYSAIGVREDLTDVIYNISPTETPFMTSIGKATAKQTLHEWQTDALASADTTNAQFQGDDISTFDSVTPTTRLGNRTQISRKTVVISGTEDIVNKAGRKSEVAYQVAKKMKELKRDMEAILTTNQAKATGASTIVPKLASLGSWVHTNVSYDTVSGANPTGDGTDARTDGTARAITESMLKTVLKGCFDNSGDAPEFVMAGSFNKQSISAFTGNATRFDKSEDKKLYASVDVYEYDFGTVRIVPNRFQRTGDVWVINSDLWACAYLRPFQVEDLAKTGDAEKKMILVEYTLEARNQAGSGLIADLTTS